MRKSSYGLTLIETLVATALLFMFISGIFIVLQIILQTVGQSRVKLVASSLAQERLEIAKNLSYNNVGVSGGIPSGYLEASESAHMNGNDFTILTSVTYIDDPFDGLSPTDSIPNDYKRVRISIDWDGPFVPKSPMVFLTDIAPLGLESDISAGTLSLEIFDAHGSPVSNADVSIKADTVNPAIDLIMLSDDQGKVILPGAPICVDCYEISVTKSGYSTDRTYSTSEVTNPLKPHLSILDGQLTHTSFSIDRTSSLTVQTLRSRQVGYSVFQGVHFTVRGQKTIGTNALDEPVYKYEESYVTAALGIKTISNLEWDTYDVFFPSGSSIDVAGSVPTSPFGISPATNRNIKIVTEANTTNSLLVAVKDPSGNLLPAANISIFENDVPVATESTGLSGTGDQGQAYFGGLNQTLHTLLVTLSGYQNATGSVSIAGDMKELILLNDE